MNRLIIASLACVALTAGAARTARAGLVNSSFEDPSIGAAALATYQTGVTPLPGWTVETGSVLVEGSNYFALAAAGGTQYAELTNLGGPASLSQVIQATAGATYQLSFEYAGNVDYLAGKAVGDSTGNKLTYQLFDGTTSTVLAHDSMVISAANLGTWKTLDLQAIATSDLLGVRFLTDGVGNDGFFGPAIDNIALAPAGTLTSAPAPEPSSLLLTATAGAMALVYRLRRR